MTVKATSLLCIVVIWASTIAAVVREPDAWWAIVFAALATGAVGISAMRRLGLSRVIAIAGTWGGAAVAFGSNPDATWMAVFAFLSTGAIVYSPMRKDAYLTGLGIAAAWAAAGATTVNDVDAAWTCVFAFLTAATLAGSGGNPMRAVVGMLAWGAFAAVAIPNEGYYWLAVLAWLATMLANAGGFAIPRRFEWDLFDRDDRPGDGPDVRLGSEGGWRNARRWRDQ